MQLQLKISWKIIISTSIWKKKCLSKPSWDLSVRPKVEVKFKNQSWGSDFTLNNLSVYVYHYNNCILWLNKIHSGKFLWHGLTFKNWAKATCVLQASFTVSMAFMKLFTYPLYASRTVDLQNCSKMKYKTAIRG